MELSIVNAAGDALVTVALAGSLFFAVPTGEARSKVALYLLITMVPFVLLAPVIGPLLDRVAYGRRTALAALCLGRGMLAWQLAGALDSLQVYPLALGLLVLSRGFGVARSAVIPRVTPPELTLVKVNSRMSLVNIVAGSVVAPLGLALAQIPFIGYPWVLRICATVYMAGVLFAFNLPGHVDSAEGERSLRQLMPDRRLMPTRPWRRGVRANMRARLRAVLGAMPVALRATLVLRALVGFLTFFLAFLLRAGGGNNVWLGGLAVAAGVGSGLGVFVGGRLGRRRPEGILMLALLMAAGGCLGAAINFSRFTSLVAALLATMAGSMAKLALDAVIQRDIAEDTRNSAFARSETGLQLAWVAGGALGLVEIPGVLGFALAAVAVAATMFVDAGRLRSARTAARTTTARSRPDQAHHGAGRRQTATATPAATYPATVRQAAAPTSPWYEHPVSYAYEVPPTRPDAAPSHPAPGPGPDPDEDTDPDSTLPQKGPLAPPPQTFPPAHPAPAHPAPAHAEPADYAEPAYAEPADAEPADVDGVPPNPAERRRRGRRGRRNTRGTPRRR
jgi:MFS family permease